MGPKEFERTKGKKAKPKLSGIAVRFAEQGYIGSLDYENADGPYIPSKQYALADRAAVDKFLDDHLGSSK